MSEKAFDVLAPRYDSTFSQTAIGTWQRMASRKWLQNFLSGKTSLRILEINCGTGDDALWLASLGHEVVATDQSPQMIEEARCKLELYNKENMPQFSVCDFEDLHTEFCGHRFDLIFSNFSGLNCVAPDNLKILGEQLYSLLKPQGCMAVVLFGKYTWWETFYYLLKMQPRKAFRRWGSGPHMARLTKEVQQPVFYYSVRKFVRSLKGFVLAEKKPVGLFIPPSYLEKTMQKRKGLLNYLVQLERAMGHLSAASSLADHTYILLKKRS